MEVIKSPFALNEIKLISLEPGPFWREGCVRGGGGYVQEVYPGVDMRPGIPWDMVGKWAIRILPECFPIRNGLRVYKCYYSHLTTKND